MKKFLTIIQDNYKLIVTNGIKQTQKYSNNFHQCLSDFMEQYEIDPITLFTNACELCSLTPDEGFLKLCELDVDHDLVKFYKCAYS